MKLFLILMTALIFSFSAFAQSVKVSVDTVLRKEPNGEIIEVLHRGRDLKVLREQALWLFVNTGKRRGWVLTNKLMLINKGYRAAPPLIENKVQPRIISDPLPNNRVLSGMIYFTNDTPPNKDTFPVELFTADHLKRVAVTHPNRHGGFEIKNIPRGKYLLKITWKPYCTLWYRVDFTKVKKKDTTIIMDAACGDRPSPDRKVPIPNLPEN